MKNMYRMLLVHLASQCITRLAKMSAGDKDWHAYRHYLVGTRALMNESCEDDACRLLVLGVPDWMRAVKNTGRLI